MIKKLKIIERLSAWCLMPTSILIVFVPGNFLSSILGSFAFQIMCYAVLMSCFWFYKKSFRLVVMGLVAAFLISSTLPPILENSKPEALKDTDLKVAHFNVLKYNHNRARIVNAALKSEADFISFQEVDHRWAEDIFQRLCSLYPYSKVIPFEDNTLGLAVFSKYPMENIHINHLGQYPILSGDILIEDQCIYFNTCHVSAPITYKKYRLRNQLIQTMANQLEKVDGPKLSIGDFNTVPWDSAIGDFKQRASVSDSRKSLTPTFPRYFKPALIPIDYIFHSKELKCVKFSSIDNVSSDHLGVIGYYQLDKQIIDVKNY